MDVRKIAIAGGTGHLGSRLARRFAGRGAEVVILSREADAASVGRRVVWDARTVGDWARELDGTDVVLNLAGRSVNCRYHAANRRAILDSRVDSTRAIGRAIATCDDPPPLWLQASTATIYAHRFDAPNDEPTGLLGGAEPGAPDTWRFSVDVARAWEAALDEADTPRTRKVALRAAMVMDPDPGGVFDTLLRLVRLGLGGRAGDGRQFVSWIHHADFARALDWLIDRGEFEGPVNLAAPLPLPNSEFMRALRVAWGQPIGLPATSWMIEMGAWAMRTESELVLKSRRVVPGRLLESGFQFEFPDWPGAAANLCRAWREGRRALQSDGPAR